MSKQELKNAVNALLAALSEARPEEVRETRDELRGKIAEMRASGMPVPADLLQFEDPPRDDDGDDEFDNMPI